MVRPYELCVPPGFRFHPTDEELVSYDLPKKVMYSPSAVRAIAEVDLNKWEPWDLPGEVVFNGREAKGEDKAARELTLSEMLEPGVKYVPTGAEHARLLAEWMDLEVSNLLPFLATISCGGGKFWRSIEAKGEDRAALYSEIVTPRDPLESFWSKMPKSGMVKGSLTGATGKPVTATHLMQESEEPMERSFPKIVVGQVWMSLHSEFQTITEPFDLESKEEEEDPWAVYRNFTRPRKEYWRELLVYPEFTCMPLERLCHYNVPDTFKRGSCKRALTSCFFASTIGAVGAIAPETAQNGYMQAGNSKADTSNFWFGVVACIGVLFAIVGVVVAIMQLRRSRRSQTVSAPTQQTLTMARRSRVHYIVEEEETIHRIDEVV
jgi:hypothetical protein